MRTRVPGTLAASPRELSGLRQEPTTPEKRGSRQSNKNNEQAKTRTRGPHSTTRLGTQSEGGIGPTARGLPFARPSLASGSSTGSRVTSDDVLPALTSCRFDATRNARYADVACDVDATLTATLYTPLPEHPNYQLCHLQVSDELSHTQIWAKPWHGSQPRVGQPWECAKP